MTPRALHHEGANGQSSFGQLLLKLSGLPVTREESGQRLQGLDLNEPGHLAHPQPCPSSGSFVTSPAFKVFVLLTLDGLFGLQNAGRRKGPDKMHWVSSDLETYPPYFRLLSILHHAVPDGEKNIWLCLSMVQGLSFLEFSNFLFGFY